MAEKKDGTCCGCGYSGQEDTPCVGSDDGTHCVHWLDADDTTCEHGSPACEACMVMASGVCAMSKLVGKTIVGVLVNEDETMLRFQCEDGPVTFAVDGYCCSESWFADLVGYQALIGRPVHGVRKVELAEGKPAPEDAPTSDKLTAEGRTRQMYDALYGYVITTDRGRCTVAFRNSSNGYYGGFLSFTEEDAKTWRLISDDWSA